VALGDLNGDTKPDLAVVDEGANTISVLLNNGNGTFGTNQDFWTGITPRSVAIGDLNGDTRPDLVVANGTSNAVSVLLGDGHGGFTVKQDYGAGLDPRCVAITYVNADAKPDLVVANNGSSTISVLLNVGSGAAGVPPSVSSPFPVRVSPNPAYGSVSVRFGLERAGRVTLGIYDVAGRLVRTVLDRALEPGVHVASWDQRDACGLPAAAGAYYLLLQSEDGRMETKAVLLR
jgi:PPE-repeat protein